MEKPVYQAQEKGCGFATVKMALIHMSKNRGYAFLSEPLVEVAPDLASLISYGKEFGLHLRAYECPSQDLYECMEHPLLLLLRGEKGLHMVYLASRRAERFLILDPSKGRKWVRLEDLEASFTGVFLRIESYEKKDEDFTYFPPVSMSKMMGLSSVLALLPMAFCILGFFLLDLSFPPIYFLGSLLASLFFSILERFVLLVAMERFDARYASSLDAKGLRKRNELYVHYHSYKNALFGSRVSAYTHLASLVGSLAFFCFHDLYLVLSMGVGVCLVALFHLLFGNGLEERKEKAVWLENQYLEATVGENGRKKMREELFKETYRYGRIYSFVEGSGLLLSLLLSSLALLFQGVYQIGTFVLYFFALSYVLSEANKLFESSRANEKLKKEEPYFRLHIA